MVYSNTNSYYYLQAATYDAAGRLDVRFLGATSLVVTPVLKTNLDYGDKENRSPWNQQGGRLKYLQAGIPSSLTSLQSFEYDYDPVGNIDWIKDYAAGDKGNLQLTAGAKIISGLRLEIKIIPSLRLEIKTGAV